MRKLDLPDPGGHAARRMERRRVSLDAAEYVLNEADTDLPAEIPGARKMSATYGGRRYTIVVILLRDDGEGNEVYELCTVW